MPHSISSSWLAQFAEGLRQDLSHFQVALIGGDTVSTPGPLSLGLTAFGWADPAHCPHRSGAKVGDDIWVSGTIGDGGAGLLAAQGRVGGSEQIELIRRYEIPEPRLALGLAVAPLATAAMDVSDGLLQDVGHLARQSGLQAEIELAAIPLSAAFKATGLTVLQAAAMGDDYEILFCAMAQNAAELQTLARSCAVDMTRIGRMIPGAGVRCLDQTGQEVIPQHLGWQHFKDDGRRP